MIRFCDKEAVACTVEEITAMSRGEILSFFWKNGTLLVLLVFEEDGSFYGFITYDCVLKNVEMNDYIIKTKLYVSDSFWEDANTYFEKEPEGIVPVCNGNGEILGFCYLDGEVIYATYRELLKYVDNNLDTTLFIKEIWTKVQQVCITDCNELAYRIYEICLKKGIPVCLIGEKWEWFGYTTCDGIYDYPEYAKFYIYAEGNKVIRAEEEFLFYGRWGSVWGNLEFLRNIMKSNIASIRYKKEKQWTEKGIRVCNVILPKDSKVRYKTKTELEMERYHLTLDEYVRCFDNLSIKKRKIVEKLYGENNCNFFREIGSNTDYGDRKYLQQGKLYYVSNWVYQKRIYIIGPCITAQMGVRTKENIVSRLQSLVEKNNYSVIGCTIPNGLFEWDSILDKLPIRKSDIVIFISEENSFNEENKKEFLSLETLELYESEEREDWYADEPIHMNATSTKVLAEYIYSKYLKEEIESRMQLDKMEALQYLQRGEILSDVQLDMIEKYIQSVNYFQIDENKIVGSIVMNCNPFTLGHQYLIETAAEKVDYLYIFVVQENKSFYEFEERMEMVKKGTRHIHNVVVVPSGEMILSFQTLPVYFEKQEKKDAIVDATTDLEIFGQYIAPKLNIKYRFVGEEPLDNITRQYNEQMKEVLSLYGITVVEIPRKELNDRVISASFVRELIEEGKYEECKQLVPESTLEIIFKK